MTPQSNRLVESLKDREIETEVVVTGEEENSNF
jgi:hypothetical protein